MFHDRGKVIQSGAVQDGDIDPSVNTEFVRKQIREKYLSDSSVTVVLVGERTWQRKHVDWEISASIRDTAKSPRSGLVGIIVPTHPEYRNPDGYSAYSFAKMYWWTEDQQTLQRMVHEAYLQKQKVLPSNTRVLYGTNRTGTQWTD